MGSWIQQTLPSLLAVALGVVITFFPFFPLHILDECVPQYRTNVRSLFAPIEEPHDRASGLVSAKLVQMLRPHAAQQNLERALAPTVLRGGLRDTLVGRDVATPQVLGKELP